MNIFNLTMLGNIKRIREFDALGLRPDAIARKFNEHGIKISTNLVNSVLSGELEELDRVALPKQVVTSLKAEIEELGNGIIPI